MFKCTNCGRNTFRGEPLTRVTLKTREKVYPPRAYANRWHEPSRTWPADPGGKGTEIVEEGDFCPRCAAARRLAEGQLTPEVLIPSSTRHP